MLNPVLDQLAARLQHDLRLRFPEITVRFFLDEDGRRCPRQGRPPALGRRGNELR